MPKRASRKTSLPRSALMFAGLALALFVAGEAFVLVNTDSGQLKAARYFRIGDPARVTQLVGRQVRGALELAGVAPDSIHERVREGRPRVAWRIGLPHDASLLQTNYAITKHLADQGAVVMSARERPGRAGEGILAMQVGLPDRATHDLELVRAAPPSAGDVKEEARIALVLFGFDTLDAAEPVFDIPLPFAVALTPGEPESQAIFRAARKRSREVVLHLPLEPLNYPRVNPGPGTILVTMNKSAITGLVKRYLDQAGPVTAVANYMGSLATQDMVVMTAVYDELRRRHVPFLHVSPAAGAVCKSLAADIGVSYEEPDAVIDSEARADSPKALQARWAELLKEARLRRSMVVMVRATPLVRAWLPRAAERKALAGTSLVPLAAAIRTPPAL